LVFTVGSRIFWMGLIQPKYTHKPSRQAIPITIKVSGVRNMKIGIPDDI